ncbi:MAG: APC family permease [Thaumarchaeota archaeon]|nr:APC family permease [Nitrososphaerota archaeon]
MQVLSPKVRIGALALKTVGLVVGVLLALFALGYVYDELTFLTGPGGVSVGDVLAVLAGVSLVFSGGALVAQLPESLLARFRRLPHAMMKRRPVYGLGTMLAVGVGATLGSPLFILIPENILQYEFVSILSLILATLLSVAMAKVYSDMYITSKKLGLEGVGGPSFTKVAVGARSVRYFVSRLSMWVSNTALAAYTKIVFLIFVLDPRYLPSILNAYGLTPFQADVTTYTVAGAFVAWTILNVLFEQRYLKMLGLFQIVMTAALLVILVYHSLILGATGSWNFSGLFGTSLGPGWVSALVINTGYLYLLFFGFQEIQSLERDSMERSKVPILSWVKRGLTLERTKYLGVAMVLSVVVASLVNILYGLAVYSSHASLQGSAIPALFLAGNLLGPGQELLVAIAFLIATVTTFVPAFLAAARHLGSLGEDGYMPTSLANLSWVFTLVAILLLAVGNQDFLVNITDFMVLISLGIISLSAIWLRRRSGPTTKIGRALPLLVGLSCFVFGGAVYFVNPSVVVFGSMAVIFAYLIFDIIELGTLGAQLFLSAFGFMSIFAMTAFRHTIYEGGILKFIGKPAGIDPSVFVIWGLLLSSTLLAINVLIDVRILQRTSVF